MVNSACWSFTVSIFQFYENKWRTALFSVYAVGSSLLDSPSSYLSITSNLRVIFHEVCFHFEQFFSLGFFFPSPYILLKKLFFESLLIKIVEKILLSLPPSLQCLLNQPRFHSMSPFSVLRFICSPLQSFCTNLAENIPSPKWLHWSNYYVGISSMFRLCSAV